MNQPPHLQPVLAETIPDYPLDPDLRLDSHRFIPWEPRRWLSSDMGLYGTPECRALYFDLICHSLNSTPPGTLPEDRELLARLLRVDGRHFGQLCQLEFGPLHNWQRCRVEGKVRLYHPVVLRMLDGMIERRDAHRAGAEAAARRQRMHRLRKYIAVHDKRIAASDPAVSWILDWAEAQGIRRFSEGLVLAGMRAWVNHRKDTAQAFERAR